MKRPARHTKPSYKTDFLWNTLRNAKTAEKSPKGPGQYWSKTSLHTAASTRPCSSTAALSTPGVLSWRIRALGVLSWRNHLQRADALGVRRVAREDLDEGEAVGVLAGPQPSESRDRKCATIVW